MSRRERTRTMGVAAVGIASAALALSACVPSNHGGVNSERTRGGQALTVSGIDEPTDVMGPAVRASAADGYVIVTTLGSSSCPGVPEIDEISDGVITLTVTSDYDGICTADLRPTTFELPVNQNVTGYTVIVTPAD